MNLEPISELLHRARDRRPLVHHITNYVTVNDCANITLAAGGSPVMADAIEEAAQIASVASSLVLNMGTLRSLTVESMVAAGKAANAAGGPVVFDPVGAGASDFRTRTAKRILEEVGISILRGNVSEISCVAGLESRTRGVDAADEGGADRAELALSLSRKLGCAVVITGRTDTVAYGSAVYLVDNGVAEMSNLTGTGCMLTSILGVMIGAGPERKLEAAAAGTLVMGIAGELALASLQAAGRQGSGSFRAALHDQVSLMTPETLVRRAKIRENG